MRTIESSYEMRSQLRKLGDTQKTESCLDFVSHDLYERQRMRVSRLESFVGWTMRDTRLNRMYDAFLSHRECIHEGATDADSVRSQTQSFDYIRSTGYTPVDIDLAFCVSDDLGVELVKLEEGVECRRRSGKLNFESGKGIRSALHRG